MTAGSVSPSLLDRVRGHDPAAWDRLVRLYTPLDYLWVRTDGVPDGDAADAAQDVFLDIARSLPHFRRDRPDDTFTGWVRTIARRRAIDHVRARGRAVAAAGGSDALQQLQEFPDPPAADPDDLAPAAADLVHRDVTPDNVWLTTDGPAKLLDFGLVRAGGDAVVTHPGTIVGTPRYMAPEQARADAADPRSDLFGLGAVLFYALTAAYPFPGDDVLAVLAARATHTPRRPTV